MHQRLIWLALTAIFLIAESVAIASDSAGQATAYIWNGQNQRLSQTLGTGLSPTIDYAWDGNGNRTQVSTTGQTIKASYDALNQLETLTHPDGSVTRFAYDDAGNRSGITHADGSTTSYQYNEASQLTAVTHRKADGSEIARFAYTLNAAGQRTQVHERLAGVGAASETIERTVSYQYDAAGKLQQEQITQTAPAAFSSTMAYQYDAAGNRTQRSVSHSGQVTTYQYDANDRLVQASDSLDGTTRYTWDNRGNLAQQTSPAGTTQYTWTTDNRLAKVTTGAKTIEYGYDTSGRRIKRLVKEGATATETHYRIDHQRAYSEIVIESTRVNNGAWVDTVHVHTPDGVGELIASSGSGSATQYFADGLGSVRVAQDAAQRHAYSYDAFGVELGSDEGMPANDAAAHAVSHRYTGEYTDRHTGLIYLRARDYDPKVGRFISMDEHPGSQRIPLTLNKISTSMETPIR